jgi:hypothetical protein
MTATLQPQDLRAITPPLPPARPDGLEETTLVGSTLVALADAPLPPRRPGVGAQEDGRAIRLPRMILGAQPILPPTFTAYAPLR